MDIEKPKLPEIPKVPGILDALTLVWNRMLNSARGRLKEQVEKRKEQAETPGQKFILAFLGEALESDDKDKDTDQQGGWLQKLLGRLDDKKAEEDANGITDPEQRQRTLDRLGNLRSLKSGVGEGAKTFIPVIHELIREKNFSIPPSVFIGLVAQESGFNSKARSPADCYGLAQLKPTTAEEVAKKHSNLGIAPSDALSPEWLKANPKGNLLLGMQYLEDIKNGLPGDLRSSPDVWYFALASYNGGPGNFSKSLKKFHGDHPGQVPTWEGVRPYLVSQENKEYAPRIAQKIDQYVGSDNPLRDANA